MAKYRKRPIEIEAVRCADALSNATNDWNALPSWLRDAYEGGRVLFGAGEIVISTLEGKMTANRADWVIRGVAGEIYPCKPDIFEKTYEPC